MLSLGIDLSTQATKALVVDSDTGRVVAQARRGHPEGTEVDPQAWWQAASAAIKAAVSAAPEPVEAVSVAGQQHGMVALDDQGVPVRNALLWNDTRSAAQASALVERHGARELAERTGVVPVASFTISKLAWLAENEPENARRVDQVLLPHDWLTWLLAGQPAQPWTDRGDASGTGYFSAATGQWLPDLLSEAMGGHAPRLPEVRGPAVRAGEVHSGGMPQLDGAILGAGTGDNMAAALGLALQPGDVAVSVGTSGTVFAVSREPVADASGTVAGFCDATGRYLPLVCTLNAARVLDSTARLLGTDLSGLSDLALAAEPGADGLVLLPYLDGERTPNLPDASGVLAGLTTANSTRENLARAAVEGMLCGLVDGVQALRDVGVEVQRVLLIGGGAASTAVRVLAPSLFGAPVEVPDQAEYVALGAARQAAWAVSNRREPPAWRLGSATYEPHDTDAGQSVLAHYRQVRRETHGV